MTRDDLLNVLRELANGVGPWAADLEVGAKCAAASRAIYKNATGSDDLPDKDAAEREKGEGPSNFPRYQVPGQSGPDRYDPSDNGSDDAA